MHPIKIHWDEGGRAPQKLSMSADKLAQSLSRTAVRPSPMHVKQPIIDQPELFPFKSKFFVERFRARFTSEKVLQSLHLFLAAATLQNRVTISPTFLAIHRILLEIRVEQVATENLGTEIWVSNHAIIESSHHEIITLDKAFIMSDGKS